MPVPVWMALIAAGHIMLKGSDSMPQVVVIGMIGLAARAVAIVIKKSKK